MSLQPSVTRSVVLASAATVAALALPGPALGATNEYVIGPVFANGAHQLYAKATASTNPNPNLENWGTIRSWEASPAWDTICNWQAQLSEIAPNGRDYVFTETSSRHSGCSFLPQFKDWQNWSGPYRENTRLRFKWQSDATSGGNWQKIGDIRD